MNSKLTAIGESASDSLKHLIQEAELEILAAWHASEQTAMLNEAKPKFRLTLTVTLDLDANKMETSLTFGVRHKLSRDQSIPDPDQQNFDGALAGSTVTVSGEQFSRAAAIIKAKTGDKS